MVTKDERGREVGVEEKKIKKRREGMGAFSVNDFVRVEDEYIFIYGIMVYYTLCICTPHQFSKFSKDTDPNEQQNKERQKKKKRNKYL